MSCTQIPDWSIFSKVPKDDLKQIVGFHVYGSSGNDLIYCTQKGRVYRLCSDAPTETAVEFLALRDRQIHQIVSSERGTVIILTLTDIFTLGNNQYGQIGNAETSNNLVKEPFLLSNQNPFLQNRVVKVALGTYHCACVTENGDLYTWGASRVGEQLKKLGHNENPLVPNRVEQARYADGGEGATCRFVQVACNSETTFALDVDGRVYTCSGNKFMNFNNERIIQISCSVGHSLAVSSYGSVFAWGKNYRKQLALQTDEDPVKEPKRVPWFDNPYLRITSVLACNTTSLAVGHTGICYVWGETRLSGKVQFYYAQAERELDEKNKATNNYYYWMLPRTCTISVPTPCSANTKGNLFAALQEEMIGPSITPHLIRLDTAANGTLETGEYSGGLDAIFDNSATSDFTINVEDHIIHAHRSILLTRSAYFRSMLSAYPNQWKEGSEGALEIKDTSFSVYRAFIYYLYKGSLPGGLSMEDCFCLLELADLYGHEELKMKVFDYALANWLTYDQVFELCGMGLRRKADMVVSRCVSFILNNLTTVTKMTCFERILDMIEPKDVLAIYQKANDAQLFKS